MTRLLDRLTTGRALRQRDAALTFQTWLSYFTFDGLQYAIQGRTTMANLREEIGADYSGFAKGAYRANGIIFGIIGVRMLVLSEARFQYQELRSGRPGKLFGDTRLSLLEEPWPGGTTGDLVARMELDNNLAGNSYVAKGAGSFVEDGRSFRIAPHLANQAIRLRPDWVTCVLGSTSDPDAAAGDTSAEKLGYIYYPGGYYSGREPVFYEPNEVAHYAPFPDPDAVYRGMSWLSPVIADVQGDQLATEHKLAYFENGGTPNIIVSVDVKEQEVYNKWVEAYRDRFERNPDERFKTIILGAGAKADVVGSNLRDIEFKAVQGGGETRLAVAGMVPPAILGISEGLSGSSLNEGNYTAARRRFSDGLLRPLWRNLAGSLQTIVPPPRTASRLWYDERDVAFLREDEQVRAETTSLDAASIRTFTDAGFTPESAVDAVESGDYSRLVHTGLFSVQLQTPGAANPTTNGNGDASGSPGDRSRQAYRALEDARQALIRAREEG